MGYAQGTPWPSAMPPWGEGMPLLSLLIGLTAWQCAISLVWGSVRVCLTPLHSALRAARGARHAAAWHEAIQQKVPEEVTSGTLVPLPEPPQRHYKSPVVRYQCPRLNWN